MRNFNPDHPSSGSGCGRALRAARSGPPRLAGLGRGWIESPFLAPRALRGALSDRASLTRRLKFRHADFRVQPVFRGLAPPVCDEARLLRLPHGSRAYVREVLLLGAGEARVFAHSVLARASLRGAWHGIAGLGTRPLGEALFANPRIHRLALSVRRLDARHPLYRAAQRHAGGSARTLWARRSVFCLNGAPLLVTEIFLPAFCTS